MTSKKKRLRESLFADFTFCFHTPVKATYVTKPVAKTARFLNLLFLFCPKGSPVIGTVRLFGSPNQGSWPSQPPLPPNLSEEMSGVSSPPNTCFQSRAPRRRARNMWLGRRHRCRNEGRGRLLEHIPWARNQGGSQDQGFFISGFCLDMSSQ